MEQEPTLTPKYDSESDEEEVRLLKTRSFRKGNAINGGDSTLSTVIGSSSSTGSESSSISSVSADESNSKELSAGEFNGKELSADGSNGKELRAEENGHVGAVGSAETSESLEEPDWFHGGHHDGTNGSVYFNKDQGTESNGVSVAEPVGVDENPDVELNKPDIQNGLTDEVNHQVAEVKDIAREKSVEEYNTSLQRETQVLVSADADVIEEELDKELTEEYDVEKVLENQETHDLFCPNCNSCITRRVVLKPRKRKLSHGFSDSKRGKPEIIGPSKADDDPITISNDENGADNNVYSNDSSQAGAGARVSEGGPSIFTCLSCFSFFIPEGNGFKLFGASKDNREIETPLISQQTNPAKTGWFFSIFGLNKKEKPVEKATSGSQANQLINPNSNSPLENVPPSDAIDQSTAQDSDANMVKSKQSAKDASRGSSLSQTPPTEATQKSDLTNETSAVLQGVSVTTSIQGKSPVNLDATVEDDASKFQNTGLKILVSSAAVSSLAEKETGVTNRIEPSNKGGLSPIQSSYDIKVLNVVTIQSHNDTTDTEVPPKGGASLLEEPQISNDKRLESAVGNKTTGDKAIVIVDSGIIEPKPYQVPLSTVPTESHSLLEDAIQVNVKPYQVPLSDVPTESPSLLEDAIQVNVNVTPQNVAPEGRKLEILKSIVYGGLIESITSLGVISSAAGSGASTLNILVLGLANLIGGLILIVHNLQELKDGNPGRTTPENNQLNNQEDRYHELLGRRENFRLHAFVAVFSFIVFGLIPPVVYGFSFRESDNKDYKAAAVLAASLVCIILLAIGKAHVKEPRKSYVKTVLYYVSIAVAASGISYIVGDVVSELIEKYGWFDTSTSPARVMMPLLGRKGLGFGYSSY